MTERAAAERRLAEIEATLPSYGMPRLVELIAWLIAELRAAWESEDFWKEEFRKHVDDAEAAGYRRGLAAARAALETLLTECEVTAKAIAIAEGCAVDSWPEKHVRKCVAVIDALAAGALDNTRKENT